MLLHWKLSPLRFFFQHFILNFGESVLHEVVYHSKENPSENIFAFFPIPIVAQANKVGSQEKKRPSRQLLLSVYVAQRTMTSLWNP